MTRYLIPTFLFSLLLISTANGQNNHRLGVSSSLNTKQTDAVGLAIKYQWQFAPSFAFESQYSTSGDIKIYSNTNVYLGDQTLLSIGAVFLKKYNPELIVKFSSGANYVISSSNETFIQQSSVSPYLKLALEYQLTEQLFVEAGQASYFQGDQLGNNHNFFIGVNYLFSSPPIISVKPLTSTKPLPAVVTHNTNNENYKSEELVSDASLTTPSDAPLVTKNKMVWVIQLGAYTDEFNADEALKQFKLNPLLSHYHVEFFNKYFRVISPRFHTYNAAQQDSIKLTQQLGVSNLIKQRD